MAYLFLVRHGQTDGNDPDREIVRSWGEYPLNEQGHKQAIEAGETLKNKQIAHIFHDGMSRTRATAQHIADATGAQIHQMQSLKDWNLGAMIGKPVDSVLPQIKHYEQHPDATPPGGETFNTAYERYKEGLLTLMHMANSGPHDIAAVIHARNFSYTPSILTDRETPVDRAHVPEPGTIVPIRVGMGKFSMGKPGNVEDAG